MVAAAIVSNAPTIQSSATVPAQINQDNRELSEMCSMFNEIKGLTECNAAYVELIVKNEQARLDTVNNLPEVPTPNLETTSGMPVLDNENVPLIEGNSKFGQEASELET